MWREVILQEHFNVQKAVGRYGYVDQAHLLNEFKRFHGLWPSKVKLEGGQRVVRFYDPDYHIIEVGENIKAVCRRFLDEEMTMEVNLKELENTFHTTEVIYLSTSMQDVVSSRPVSSLNIGIRLFVRTSAATRKAKEMTANSNIAVCAGNFYFTGKAKPLGSVYDDGNRIGMVFCGREPHRLCGAAPLSGNIRTARVICPRLDALPSTTPPSLMHSGIPAIPAFNWNRLVPEDILS